MRKHGVLLTAISAVLLIALCIGTMGLSDIFLSDYQNTIEEIVLSENHSMLMINNREAATLYPWDIYESAKSQSVISSEYEKLYSDEEIARIIGILSPWVLNGYKKVEWTKHMKYAESNENTLFYIKDVKITDEYDDAYLVNIALTDRSLIYYSCDRINTKASASEVVVPAYDKLDKDYSAFLELYKAGILSGSIYDDLWSNSSGYENYIIGFEREDNCFVDFFDKLIALDTIDAEQSEYDVVSSVCSDVDVVAFMTADATAGMIYRHGDDTPDVVNVEFSDGKKGLVLFYDLLTCDITGFSIQSGTKEAE